VDPTVIFFLRARSRSSSRATFLTYRPFAKPCAAWHICQVCSLICQVDQNTNSKYKTIGYLFLWFFSKLQECKVQMQNPWRCSYLPPSLPCHQISDMARYETTYETAYQLTWTNVLCPYINHRFHDSRDLPANFPLYFLKLSLRTSCDTQLKLSQFIECVYWPYWF